MNLNLAANSVGFYQISKLLCIPTTIVLEYILNKSQQKLTLKMILSVILIMLGMGLVAVNEISCSIHGIFWAVCGVLCTSLAQIYFCPLQKELNLNALQMLLHLSPILTIGSFLMIPIFESTKELIDFKIFSYLVIDILISTVMAVLLNVSNYLGVFLCWFLCWFMTAFD